MRTNVSVLRSAILRARERQFLLAILCALIYHAGNSWIGQANGQPFNNPQVGQQNAAIFPGGGPNAAIVGNNPNAGTGTGGGANADFESLIDLIESTVSVETWAENGGGEADIRPFPGGVLVDAAGTLRLRERAAAKSVAAKRGTVPADVATGIARQASALRYVSLPRLEREIARRQAAREPLSQEMLTLAGLQHVQYVFMYPESGDVVLAGPAGDWFVDPNGRILSKDAKSPVVRLDDLLVLLRREREAGGSHFGCSINPRQEALAKTQAFLVASKQTPLAPGERPRWLQDVRDSVGKQDIELFGIEPASRVAGVLVEADYHMKLVGMGLAEGVDGVESYLASIKLAQGEAPPSMSVLRWWFTLNYDGIAASADRDAFELVGQGVRVLSENELLAAQGQRVHTGKSEPLNQRFAESFTTHFAELAAKYPVYGELRNIFDLAMALALVQEEKLAERAGWKSGSFVNEKQLPVPKSAVPRTVETVINHRVINRVHIVAGVSGGVMVAPEEVLREPRIEGGESLSRKRILSAGEAWWWDGGGMTND